MTQDPISEELFKILACPICKSDLKYSKDKKNLLCAKCKKEFPIKNGIPVLV